MGSLRSPDAFIVDNFFQPKTMRSNCITFFTFCPDSAYHITQRDKIDDGVDVIGVNYTTCAQLDLHNFQVSRRAEGVTYGVAEVGAA